MSNTDCGNGTPYWREIKRRKQGKKIKATGHSKKIKATGKLRVADVVWI